ncbi:ATP-dependent DNA helicase RecG [Corynebacterium freiburgense]|uniref:ATP-dependent DNA helicase RecG n=1 Tax=Corynebacterium freiburgense TaxID=556548 RepID=UPI00041835CC|nr:ATP-dependent DNA helicase RecG [Corynebacterium freiburgense]WJZ02479.1 ATP-dependent DNA helicase RecG [Corynebacterium freiburgense]
MLGWTGTHPLQAVLPGGIAQRIRDELGITTCEELLQYYPRTWSKNISIMGFQGVREGDHISIIGDVIEKKHIPLEGKRSLTEIKVADGPITITATFFNTGIPSTQMQKGNRVFMSGKLGYYKNMPRLGQPAYFTLRASGKRITGFGGMSEFNAYSNPEEIVNTLCSLHWIPIYPAKRTITSWQIFAAMHIVLQTTPIPEPLDYIPPGLMGMAEATLGIHEPDSRGPNIFAQRLKYNEALTLAIVMALRRADTQQRKAQPCPPIWGFQRELFEVLPYDLTEGQHKVVAEISEDLSSTTPMNRLLQGEVGSGKTVVSLAAMLQVVDAGRQCVLLAPTEVLATQHARTLNNLLLDIPVNIITLTGAMPVPAKRQALLDIVSGDANIIVGTHALIQEGVEFFDLGLVVIDEQHRFGVEQRDTLRNRGKDGTTPHVLVMTATPIPRTVAMTVFGDLSVSTLRELPGGRRKIKTFVVPEEKKVWVQRMWNRIREELSLGHQGYIVCPRIEGEGGVLETYQHLSDNVLTAHTLAILHGRMAPEAKERVMRDFARGYIDVLVATTVIEVGVDVSNATVMLVREAEHFGVSQLHQLRGRIGRGSIKSTCFFHTKQKLTSPSFQRLQAIAQVDDGFRVAEIDLQYRHEGDVLGTAQSGVQRRVKLLSLVEDYEIIRLASADAHQLVSRNRALAEKLISDLDIDEQVFLEKS